MRKIMLAATAISGLGVLAAGQANAQMPPQPIVSPATGLATQSGSFPEPGTVVPFLRSRLEVQFGMGNDSSTVQKPGTNVLLSGGSAPGSGNGLFATGTKSDQSAVQEYVRIYTGFDAKSAHGLEYGALVEIRQENAANVSAQGPVVVSKASVSGTTTIGQIDSASLAQVSSSTSNVLFFRREAAYIGTPAMGRLWFGYTDNSLSRLNVAAGMAGEPEGGWNGAAQRLVSGPAVVDYAFPGNSWTYTQGKIEYVSPVFAGFDFGLGYEPNQSTGEDSCPYGFSTSNCQNISTGAASTVNAAGLGLSPILQRRNTFDANVRYRGSFGPVAVAGQVGTMQSGTVSTSNLAATAPRAKNLSILDAGASATMSGVTVGAHYIGGAMNTDNSILRTGQKNSQSFLLGVNYAFGKAVVGVQYINELSAGYALTNSTTGAVTNGSQMLHQYGIALGGTYDYAPGAEVFVSALYGWRHQAGVDMLNSAIGSNSYTGTGTAGAVNNTVTARAVAIGNIFIF